MKKAVTPDKQTSRRKSVAHRSVSIQLYQPDDAAVEAIRPYLDKLSGGKPSGLSDAVRASLRHYAQWIEAGADGA